MFLFILTAILIYNGVLAFFILKDYRLFLRILRWSTTIFLLVFGVFMAEVLREGLLVNMAYAAPPPGDRHFTSSSGAVYVRNGADGVTAAEPPAVGWAKMLHWCVLLAWSAWFLCVTLSIVDRRFLAVGVVLPLWAFAYPEVRMLINYGIVRLQWVELVYSPFTFFLFRPAGLERIVRGMWWYEGLMGRLVLPVIRLVRGVLGFVFGWAGSGWSGEGMEILRPPKVPVFGDGWGLW
ncbi:hypothetical protein F4778DRAFT_786694 [Xylariomycetidae sp. FL2044]|nr:hypothetical protein F4778DRAFT_786694 [Xylariomycetidae sp. FL2044]